jgi:hypothetical protein
MPGDKISDSEVHEGVANDPEESGRGIKDVYMTLRTYCPGSIGGGNPVDVK